MDKRYSIDTNTGWGAEWFQRWAIRRLVYFGIGAWVGLVWDANKDSSVQIKSHSLK